MKFGHLCCGAGGDILGVKLAGHESSWAIDIETHCVETIRLNHPGIALKADIRKISGDELPGVDGILCGIPCQPFTLIGKRLQEKDKRDISVPLAHLLLSLKPKIIMMENVSAYKTSSGFRYLHQKLSSKYKIQIQVLNFADYGIPQRRKRLMIIATRSTVDFGFPKPSHTSERSLFDQRIPWQTFETIADSRGTKILSAKALKGVFRRYGRHAKKGNGFSFQIIDKDDMCPTIMGRMCRGAGTQCWTVYDSGRLRYISFLEATRAQTFPDDYKFVGTLAQKWQMVGDAWAPAMVQKLIESIKEK